MTIGWFSSDRIRHITAKFYFYSANRIRGDLHGIYAAGIVGQDP